MHEQQISFCQDLVMLLKSGSDLDSALQVMIAARTGGTPGARRALGANSRFVESLTAVRGQIRQGKPLSVALAAHPDYFGPFFIGMVKSGEASGTMVAVLNELCDQLERDEALNQSIRSTLVYPIILSLAMGVSLLMVLLYVLPQLTQLFAAFANDLSLSARALLFLGELVNDWGHILLLLVLAMAMVLFFFTESLRLGARVKRCLLNLPPLRGLHRQLELARFGSSLASLLHAGLRQVDALQIAGEVLQVESQRQAVQAAISLMREGHSFSHAMRAFPEFKWYFAHSIESGEKSGQLAQSLSVVAQRLQRDFNNRAQRMVAMVEPALVIVLGLVIGFIVLTVFSTLQALGGLQA